MKVDLADPTKLQEDLEAITEATSPVQKVDQFSATTKVLKIQNDAQINSAFFLRGYLLSL